MSDSTRFTPHSEAGSIWLSVWESTLIAPLASTLASPEIVAVVVLTAYATLTASAPPFSALAAGSAPIALRLRLAPLRFSGAGLSAGLFDSASEGFSGGLTELVDWEDAETLGRASTTAETVIEPSASTSARPPIAEPSPIRAVVALASICTAMAPVAS